jgi:hypothetical protein
MPVLTALTIAGLPTVPPTMTAPAPTAKLFQLHLFSTHPIKDVIVFSFPFSAVVMKTVVLLASNL